MKNILYIFVFLCLLQLMSCKLKIISPEGLKSQFANVKGIPFQLTRYGRIPYGTNLIGNLLIADPEDLCSVALYNKSESVNQNYVPIVITREGGCQNFVKLGYAELSHIKMLIIVLLDNNLPEYPVGYEQGMDINIPAIFVKKDDGDKLFKYIKDNDGKKLNTTISMYFPYGSENPTAKLDFWFSTADSMDNVYKFLSEFKDFYLQSKKEFVFKPHYVTWFCSPCKDTGYKTKTSDCLSGGRYCAPDPDSDGPLNGKVVVIEDLRQICLWNEFPDKWWNYVAKFEISCANKEDQEKCTQSLLEEIGMSTDQIKKINKCMEDSFFKDVGQYGPIDRDLDDNKLLSNERALQDEFDISMFPSLFINHEMYEGNFENGYSVFRAACESLTVPSELCEQYSPNDKLISTGLEFGKILKFTIVILFVAVAILFLHRRKTKRDMEKEMSQQVNAIVTQYFALNDNMKKRGSATDDDL